MTDAGRVVVTDAGRGVALAVSEDGGWALLSDGRGERERETETETERDRERQREMQCMCGRYKVIRQ